MKTGPLLEKLYNCTKPIINVQGGGDSGKTITILQNIALKLTQHEKNDRALATITSHDLPNLKGGAMRAFEKYVMPDVFRWIKKYNESSHTYTFYNDAKMEFKAFEDPDDAQGSERDYLYVNECKIPYKLFWQLNRKTRRQAFIDYNPTSRFWPHEKLLDPNTCEGEFRGLVQFYRNDHRHNPFLLKKDHDMYESISDPDMFNVYSRGKTGKVTGLVMGHFKVAPFPLLYDRVFWGLDLGYTNDPTALVRVAALGKKRWAHECCYLPGLSAQTIKELLIGNGWQQGEPIYCEPDPNMINQLRLLGMPVVPAIKGPGSLAAGISKCKEFECYHTPESLNFKNEIAFYKFIEAQDLMTGNVILTNQPVDAHNHCCDSFRMAIYSDSYKIIH